MEQYGRVTARNGAGHTDVIRPERNLVKVERECNVADRHQVRKHMVKGGVNFNAPHKHSYYRT